MNEQIKKLVGIVVPYSLLCASLGLFFYWRLFEIQPFEFISISEAIAYGIPYLLISIGFLAFIIIGELLWPSTYPKEFVEKVENNYLWGSIFGVLTINGVIGVLAWNDLWLSKSYVYFLLITVMFLPAIRLGNLDKFARHFPSKKLRVSISLIICCLPAASISTAMSKRSGIVYQNDFYVISGKDIESESLNGDFPYVGHLGEYIFLLKDNSTVGYRSEDLKKLALRKGQIRHGTFLNTSTRQVATQPRKTIEKIELPTKDDKPVPSK